MDRLLLVRVEGKQGDGAILLTPELLVERRLLLRASSTANTRRAEQLLGLPQALYFYVGWANPRFGDMAFLFTVDLIDDHAGTATPFDSGGLAANLVKHESSDPPAAYFRDHAILLNQLRTAAPAFLAKYFASPKSYLTGARPLEDDPSGRLHHPENSPRYPWTWELQIYEDHPVDRHLHRAVLGPDKYEAVAALAADAGWASLLDRLERVDGPVEEVCRRAEKEVVRFHEHGP